MRRWVKCSMLESLLKIDLGPPEVLFLQRVHPGTEWKLWWRGAGSPQVGPADREAQAWCSAQVPLGCFRRASVISHEVINQLSWG